MLFIKELCEFLKSKFKMNKLFSYGTLQFRQVQLDTFGRELSGQKEVLVGYEIQDLRIKDKMVIASSGTDVHPILVHTGLDTHRVEGVLYQVSDEELAHADNYEVKDYKRELVNFESGVSGYAYLKAE